MKEFSHSQIKDIYEKRIKKVVDYLNENSIGAAVFIDNESHREPAIRYFTGHSSDAVFIIYNTGSSVSSLKSVSTKSSESSTISSL